jgi:glycosyltransferase involved in cell wall biosynthesis
VFDVRANHDTGVSRYGLSLLAATAPRAAEAGWDLIVVARPGQQQHARAAVAPLDVPVLACPDDEGFVRRSPWLRSLLTRRDVALYFTSHYTVDRLCPVPFVYTIHDLTRLKHPGYSYTDAAFAARFGARELRRIRQELQALSPQATHTTGPLFPRYFHALNQHLAARSQRIAAVSHSTIRDIRELLPVDSARIDLVPCAVDTTVFHPAPPERVRATIAKHDLTGPYVMYVGLTHPNKRFEWLLQHLLQARTTFPPGAHLAVVGGHAERMPRVREAIRRAGADRFVTFTGRVDDEELAALYTGAAAFVTASISEGYCLPSAEACACGTPVIATDIPALHETLGHAAHSYPLHNATRLVALVRDALTGSLEPRPAPPSTPAWSQSGERLMHTLTRALNDTSSHAAGYAAASDHALRIRA